jgi:hypothetical protein
LVGRVRIGSLIEEDLHDGEIPRANRLMKGRDLVAIAGIHDSASLDEENRDLRGPGTMRASKVCNAMKRRFAEAISRGHVCATIEEVTDDFGVEGLGSMKEQRRALLVHHEVGLGDGLAIPEVHGCDHGDRGAGFSEQFYDVVRASCRRMGDWGEVRTSSVNVRTPFEELPREPLVAVLRSHRQRSSVPSVLYVWIDTRDEARDDARVAAPNRLAELRDLVQPPLGY